MERHLFMQHKWRIFNGLTLNVEFISRVRRGLWNVHECDSRVKILKKNKTLSQKFIKFHIKCQNIQFSDFFVDTFLSNLRHCMQYSRRDSKLACYFHTVKCTNCYIHSVMYIHRQLFSHCEMYGLLYSHCDVYSQAVIFTMWNVRIVIFTLWCIFTGMYFHTVKCTNCYIHIVMYIHRHVFSHWK